MGGDEDTCGAKKLHEDCSGLEYVIKKSFLLQESGSTLHCIFQVNETFVSGLPRQTVIDLLRKAQGTVQLTVCRSMALHWAYSGNQSNRKSSPPNTKAEPGKQLHLFSI